MNNNNKEIERKFLVDDFWHPKSKGVIITQYYLSDTPTVRIRIADDKAFITIKGPMKSFTRSEYEYEIPYTDAVEMLSLAILDPVEKIRYTEEVAGHKWEIDVFKGKNEGLIVAEIEMKSEDEEIIYPHWIIDDVTKQDKYYNSNLAKHPYKEW
jgi:CYTH domain-containing protein